MEYKLVAFDMDGTLAEKESCWRKIHQFFNCQEEASKNLKAWEKGEIDYPEFMRRDISLWNPTPHISQIEEILSEYKLPPKAQEIMNEIRGRDYETAIISGGLDMLAEKISRDLGINHIFANGLETDKKGYLTGEGIFRVDPKQKSQILEEITSELEIKPTQCISIGDSIHDSDLFSYSGMGIMIGESNSIPDTADVVIKDFKNFDQILNYL